MIGDLGFSLTDAALGAGEQRQAALAGVAECVLGQIDRPYPCAERQTLGGPDELELPIERFPVFYGSFDWHSCVHSHWTLVRMLSCGGFDAAGEAGGGTGAGAGDLEARIVAQLEKSFSPDALAAEAKSWAEKVPAWEEKPYGWTWLLALDQELGRLAGSDSPHAGAAGGWREALLPLRDVMYQRVIGWLEGLSLAARTGTHSDTAWNLAMAHDYAAATGDERLAGLVNDSARRLFAHDTCAPVAYEPNADTFTSAVLNEAACMARVLDAAEYEAWLAAYLPQLFSADFASPLIADLPGRWDGSGYLEVHTVALPTSRGLAARDAAAALSDGPAKERLAAEAARWVTDGVNDVQLSGYLADHWVGSFVCAALLGGEAR